jgi:hypothetical protein
MPISKYEFDKLKEYNWYECIEKPIRNLVFRLRNNGFNTECSCGHEMYVQCQYIPEGYFMELTRIISIFLNENNLPINYKIELIISIIDGHQYPTVTIYLKNN